MIYKKILIIPPKTEEELLHRAQKLSGQTLSLLAKKMNLTIPINFKKNKGWVGRLVEGYLGVYQNNQKGPDFPHLGIEVKTIPVNMRGAPMEHTFVCAVPLMHNIGISWNNSYVKSKLERVLWIPVQADCFLPIEERCIGSPLLWSPNEGQNRKLCQDWEELMDMVVLGKIKDITSYYGEWLHIRKKALNSNSLTQAIGKRGEKIMTIPRAFYLRKIFTGALLSHYFYI